MRLFSSPTDEGHTNWNAFDRYAMRAALRLARRGSPSPSPHAGAVVAQDNRLVGCGFNRQSGQTQAGVAALQQAAGRAVGGTLYLTLAPCDNPGRSDPCTETIVRAGIRRVIVSSDNPIRRGAGALERLRAAGLRVDRGLLRWEGESLVADFAKHRLLHQPFVHIKAALTLDGRSATREGSSKWISNALSRREVHRMRAYADAVMVGRHTVERDDPLLTVRDTKGVSPLRVVADTLLRIPLNCRLAKTAAQHPTWIFHGSAADRGRLKALSNQGVRCIELPTDPKTQRVKLSDLLDRLAAEQVVRLLVEGGEQLNGALIQHGMVDQLSLFLAPIIAADEQAKGLAASGALPSLTVAHRLLHLKVRHFGDDTLVDGFFADALARIRAATA